MTLRKNYLSLSLAVKTTYFILYVSNLNPEGQDSSCKINYFMGNYISKLEWAWQAHILSHALQILLKDTTF